MVGGVGGEGRVYMSVVGSDVGFRPEGSGLEKNLVCQSRPQVSEQAGEAVVTGSRAKRGIVVVVEVVVAVGTVRVKQMECLRKARETSRLAHQWKRELPPRRG